MYQIIPRVLHGTILACLLSATSVYAEQGDFLVRVGGHVVAPKSDNHAVVEVDSGTMLTFNVSWFATNNLAVELLAALPFSHDIDLRTGGNVGKTKHLPPTLSLQYHFTPQARVSPYVGAGLNMTLFFDEDTRGALEGQDLSLDTSFGVAALLGVDLRLSSTYFANAEIRYLDIDTKAKLDGTSIGTVHIDPWALGLTVGRRF